MPHISRRRLSMAVLATVVLLTAACGSDDSGGGDSTPATTDVLRIAYTVELATPDPDIFYFTEGNSVVTSVYEGLVQYAADNSYTLEPGLAESWEVSPDGLTYTFTMRDGVTFHDGTPMTSADVKFSFERRSDPIIKSGMAYLTSGITSIETPDDLTVVVQLATPKIGFLDELASPYGVKVINQAVVEANDEDGDLGQAYLTTHDAGTGPFTITDYPTGGPYTLSRYDDYWGPKPELSGVNIKVVPSAATQFLELKNGELDLIFHGLTVAQLDELSEDPDYQVHAFPATYKFWMHVNVHTGIFEDQATRTALRSAIDRAAITEAAFGDYGSPGEDFYIPGMVPEGMAKDDPPYDPSIMQALAETLSDKTVDIVYTTDDARNQLVGELIQTQLQAAGLDATARGVPLSQGFTYGTADPTTNPNIFLLGGNPDSGHPDDYARPLVGTVGVGTNGSLNALQCEVPGIDALLDEAQQTLDSAASLALYGEAGDDAAEIGCLQSLSEIRDVVAARAGLGGIHHQVATVWSIKLADITLDG